MDSTLEDRMARIEARATALEEKLQAIDRIEAMLDELAEMGGRNLGLMLDLGSAIADLADPTE